jgi:hypothetical protein
VTPSQRLQGVKRGSAALALPLLLCLGLAAGLAADTSSTITGVEDGHLDAGVRYLGVKPATFDNLSGAMRFPDTGGGLLLWGGGATISPGSLRAGMSGWSGGLSASQGARTTHWDLTLASLNLEQRYPGSTYELTAGTSLDYGHLAGGLDDYGNSNVSLNRVDANLWGSSVTVGFRWPMQTKVSFFMRTAWQWLQGDGVWHGLGASAAGLGSSHFDLGGPNVTAQVEMSL